MMDPPDHIENVIKIEKKSSTIFCKAKMTCIASMESQRVGLERVAGKVTAVGGWTSRILV